MNLDSLRLAIGQSRRRLSWDASLAFATFRRRHRYSRLDKVARRVNLRMAKAERARLRELLRQLADQLNQKGGAVN